MQQCPAHKSIFNWSTQDPKHFLIIKINAPVGNVLLIHEERYKTAKQTQLFFHYSEFAHQNLDCCTVGEWSVTVFSANSGDAAERS